MNLLITGVNGFVGRAVAEYFAGQGKCVNGAVRSIDNHNPAGIDGAKIFPVGEIDEKTAWGEALNGVEVVVHLAARVHVMDETSADPYASFRKVNVDGTLNLARQAVAANVKRFIYLSSIKVNGEATLLGHPFSEEDKPAPQDAYAVSKHEAETGLLKIALETGMEVVIIRPSLVYGPGVKANFQKMIQVLSNRIPLPFGNIHNKRSLVALDNLVDLIGTCIEHPEAANQIFFVGDGEDLSTPELLLRLGAALGKTPRLFSAPQWLLDFGLKILGKGDMGKRLCGSLQVDISKAQDVLGWHPPVTVDEELEKTAAWYLDKKNSAEL